MSFWRCFDIYIYVLLSFARKNALKWSQLSQANKTSLGHACCSALFEADCCQPHCCASGISAESPATRMAALLKSKWTYPPYPQSIICNYSITQGVAKRLQQARQSRASFVKLSHHDWLVKTRFVRLMVSYGFMLSMSLVNLREAKLEDISQRWIYCGRGGRLRTIHTTRTTFNHKLEFCLVNLLTGLLAFIEYCAIWKFQADIPNTIGKYVHHDFNIDHSEVN